MKKFFCLHGLPRAGNTLLGSIINQNPKVAVTANSLIADMLGELYTLQNSDIFKNFPDHKSFDSVTKSLFDNFKGAFDIIDGDFSMGIVFSVKTSFGLLLKNLLFEEV